MTFNQRRDVWQKLASWDGHSPSELTLKELRYLGGLVHRDMRADMQKARDKMFAEMRQEKDV